MLCDPTVSLFPPPVLFPFCFSYLPSLSCPPVYKVSRRPAEFSWLGPVHEYAAGEWLQ